MEEAGHSGGAVTSDAGREGEAVRRVLDAVVRHLGVHHAGGQGGRRFGRPGRALGLFVGVLRLSDLVRPRLEKIFVYFRNNFK